MNIPFFHKRDGEKKKEKRGGAKEVARTTYVFLALFLGLIAYLVWFAAFKADSFINNSYNNKRIDAFAATTIRGEIRSREGRILAQTKVQEDQSEVRYYPEREVYCHVVGYDTHGKTGVEMTANYYLLKSHANAFQRLKNTFAGEKSPGDSVITTLSDPLQHAAYEALGSFRGAVIAMDPETGEVLCCVSKPDFDPNRIVSDYEALSGENGSGVLLNRASQGRYAPGSVFKILTTLEFLREHKEEAENYTFDCEGSFVSDGKEIRCYHDKAHGTEDLAMSFANSCNASYAGISLTLDPKSMKKTADVMLFDQPVSCQLPTEKPSFSLDAGATDAERMETGIGQGKTLVTPLQMLMWVSAVENQGTAQTPYLLKKVVNAEGQTIRSFGSKKYRTLMTKQEAEKLQELMRLVVTDGTGRACLSDSYEAYGKTGTAEYDSEGNAHSWFAGYAVKDGHEPIAVAVICEGAGAGSSYAAPVAAKLFQVYFQERLP